MHSRCTDFSSLYKDNMLRGFINTLCFSDPRRMTREVLDASSHETYVETVGCAADTLHLSLNGWSVQNIQSEYARQCEHNIRKLHLGLCDVSIDVTDEDFYGKTTSLWLHNWTGEDGVKAHFKFLVCQIKYRNRKYFIGVRMLHLGAYIADEIGELLESCRRAGLSIRTVLLDRGFYSADNIRTLTEQNAKYLIFAKKSHLFKNMLEGINRTTFVEHEITLNRHKTKTKIPTTIALVKNVRGYDWVFATNLDLTGRDIVRRYSLRWNIETDFRIHDEARIKSKSTRPEVRLFYFLISCILLFVWNATQKYLITFKKFIITFDDKKPYNITRKRTN